MSDLFLHITFARRLRLLDGLHPLVAEALLRRPALVALGAALATLPDIERKGMSFFQKLFSRNSSESARWQKQFASSASNIDVLSHLLGRGDQDNVGLLSRAALGLGFLSYCVVEATVGTTTASLDGNARAVAERNQARAWLQRNIPNSKDLAHEWRVIQELENNDRQQKILVHIEKALTKATQSPPTTGTVQRWVRGFCAEVKPLAINAALPKSLGGDESKNDIQAQIQQASSWFAALSALLGETMQEQEPAASVIHALLSADGKLKVAAPPSPSEGVQRWHAQLIQRRSRAFERGRNPESAFDKMISGSLNGLVVPRADLSHLVSGDPSTPGPVTTVFKLDQVQAAMQQMTPPPPMPAPAATPPMPPPAHTQEVSLAQIEASVLAPPMPPPPPAQTQEVSLGQVESVLNNAHMGRGQPS